MFDFLRTTSLAAVAAIGLAAAAQAATVVIVANSAQGPGNTAHLYAPGFTDYTNAGATWSTDPSIGPGNASGAAQSPFNNTPLLGTNEYFAVGPGSVPSPVTLTFGKVQSAFRMLWGSIDRYNKIAFGLGESEVFSLTGTQLAGLLGLPALSPTSSGNFEHVALLTFKDFRFDSVTFEAFDPARGNVDRNAFEFALAPVPLPAGGLLLIGGLAGLAMLRRRKAAAA